MLAAIAKLLGVDQLVGWLIGAVVISAALWGAYAYVHNLGYQAGKADTAVVYQDKLDKLQSAKDQEEAKWTLQSLQAAQANTDEIKRQAAANSLAKAEEAKAVADLQAQKDTLQQTIEELQREADQDPDHDRPAFGADSVQRINSVR